MSLNYNNLLHFAFWKRLFLKKNTVTADRWTPTPVEQSLREFHGARQMILALGFICLAVGAILLAVFVINQRLSLVIRSQEKKISALIDEVGQLKAANFDLYVAQNKQKTQTNFITGLLKKITNEYDVWQAASKQLAKTQQELQTTRDNLAKVKSRLGKTPYSRTDSLTANVLGLTEAAWSNELWNLLILGTHGSLTDTIILATVNARLRTISLISIPRDLYVNGRKINELYESYGIQKTAEVIYELTGLATHNYVVIDLGSFVNIIDTLGGIEVEVENNIYDPYYPDPDDTYTTFSLAKGQYHMDGTLALQYVRTRKTTSDFDRAKRQQQVISAVQSAFKAGNLLPDLGKTVRIYLSVKDYLKTDLDFFKALSYAKDYQNYTLETGHILTTSNYLYSTTDQTGAYILLPNTGNFAEIKRFVRKIVEE